jgi:hypothetical protein
MNLQDSCSNHHPTTTRGCLRTVNWNLNGAHKSGIFLKFPQWYTGILSKCTSMLADNKYQKSQIMAHEHSYA